MLNVPSNEIMGEGIIPDALAVTRTVKHSLSLAPTMLYTARVPFPAR